MGSWFSSYRLCLKTGFYSSLLLFSLYVGGDFSLQLLERSNALNIPFGQTFLPLIVPSCTLATAGLVWNAGITDIHNEKFDSIDTEEDKQIDVVLESC